jgi:hypothetical protein
MHRKNPVETPQAVVAKATYLFIASPVDQGDRAGQPHVNARARAVAQNGHGAWTSCSSIPKVTVTLGLLSTPQ